MNADMWMRVPGITTAAAATAATGAGTRVQQRTQETPSGSQREVKASVDAVEGAIPMPMIIARLRCPWSPPRFQRVIFTSY